MPIMGDKESKEAFVEIPSIPVEPALLAQIAQVLGPDESLEDFVITAVRAQVNHRLRAFRRGMEGGLVQGGASQAVEPPGLMREHAPSPHEAGSKLGEHGDGGFDRAPTTDEALGMAWWNGLDARDRARWLREAGSAVPADAWAAFKKGPG